MTAYLDAMRRYFDFSGRSTRSQFWLFTLVYAIILIIAAVLDAILRIDPTGEALVISGFVVLAHFIPSLSVLVRRLHDIGRSGAWVLIAFVRLIGLIVLLVFACTPSGADISAVGKADNRRDPNMVPTTQTAASNASIVEQLEKLSALKASGALDAEEFARMKADLLNRSDR